MKGNEKRDRKGKGSKDFFFLLYSFSFISSLSSIHVRNDLENVIIFMLLLWFIGYCGCCYDTNCDIGNDSPHRFSSDGAN